MRLCRLFLFCLILFCFVLLLLLFFFLQLALFDLSVISSSFVRTKFIAQMWEFSGDPIFSGQKDQVFFGEKLVYCWN